MPLFLDSPTDEVNSLAFVLAGWVAGNTAETPLKVVVDGRAMPHFVVDRPDVRDAFPQFPFSTGFGVRANLAEFEPKPIIAVEITFGDERLSSNVRVSEEASHALKHEIRLRRDAREWCMRHLRCPVCHASSRRLNFEYRQITCLKCGERYPQPTMAINFLADSLRLLGNVTLTDNISANPYDPLARQVLSETTAQEGWSLDCGAGSRERRMEHVINLEIVDYPSTDIISIGEALPFEDNVFDTVVSFAVLEHVRDPFSCAREMVRVAKPGAKIVCSVPFLQPVHGYPGHYYNMTQQGLINLFSDSAEIVDCHVPPHGHPIYAVNWLVREYLAGLPAAERAQFAAYTLGEIATTPPAQFLGSPLTSSLSVEAQGLTACLNTVVAVKR